MESDSIPPLRNIILTTFNKGQITVYIILIILFILLSGLFACIETSFSCVNKNRINSRANDNDPKAIRFKKALDKSEEYIVSILIFINIFHILCSTLATVLFVNIFGESGSIISTIVITLIVFIFSETIPKNIANENADVLFEHTMGLLTVVTYAIYPLVLIFSLPYKLITKNLEKEKETYSEEELSTIVDSIEEEGAIEEDQSALIQSAIEFDDTKAKEVYTPINKVKGIDKNLSDEDFLNRLLEESRFSRVPVYENEISNIVGYINVRSALKTYLKEKELNKDKLILSIPSFRSDTNLDDILDKLISSKTHIGIIINASNKVVGIVTLDDLLNNLTEDMIKAGGKDE